MNQANKFIIYRLLPLLLCFYSTTVAFAHYPPLCQPVKFNGYCYRDGQYQKMHSYRCSSGTILKCDNRYMMKREPQRIHRLVVSNHQGYQESYSCFIDPKTHNPGSWSNVRLDNQLAKCQHP